MIETLALLSPFLVIVGLYLFHRRTQRIRRELAAHALPINKPDYEEEIRAKDGLVYGRKSNVDDRLIEIQKQWNDPMA